MLAMTKGKFVIQSTGEKMNPAEYGYWTVKWAHDGAIGSLEQLKGPEYDWSSLVKAIRITNFPVYLQLISIYIAAYWCYATEILHIPSHVPIEMKRGLDDGIKQLKQGNGNPLNEEQVKYLRGSISVYLNAGLEDLTNSQIADPNIYNPDISVVAKKHIEIISKFYSKNEVLNELDRMAIGHFVADIPINLYRTLQSDIRLTFVP
jgi:hypothetical protein